MAQHGLQPHAPLRATSRLSYLHLPQYFLKSHSFFSSLSLRARSLSSLLLFALFLLLSFSLPFSFSLPAPRMCGPSPRQGAQTFGSRQHKRRPTPRASSLFPSVVLFRLFTFLLDENGQLNYNIDITEPKGLDLIAARRQSPVGVSSEPSPSGRHKGGLPEDLRQVL